MQHTRSRVRNAPLYLAIQELAKIMTNDWATFSTIASLQLAKETFGLRHPQGATHGKGDDVRHISLRITDMCNLRCHTCGQWGDNGYLLDKSLKEMRQNEVPVDVYKRMVDEVVEAGWSPVWYIWGGEPMMYKGLIELLYYISERKMPIMMVSNSTHMLDHVKEVADTCKLIWLSVDGHNEEIHNKQRPGVTSSVNNFRDVESALAALREEKQRRNSLFPYLAPISVVARYNVDHLVDIYKFVSQYADAHIFYLSWWIDELSAQQHTADFTRRFGFEPHTHLGWIGTWRDFDHTHVYEKFNQIYDIMKQSTNGHSNGHKPCLPLMYPFLNSQDEINRYYEDHHEVFGYNQCVSIYMTMEIDSNGDVSLCRDYHDFIIGNIKEQSVQDIWYGEPAQRFRRSISTDGIMPVCRRCCGLMGY